MRLITFIILAICFISCKQDKQQITFFKAKDFVIADTTINPNNFLNFDTVSDYPIYYIGLPHDTIKIGKRYWRGRTNWNEDSNISRSRIYSDKSLKLFVDTLLKTNSPVEYLSNDLKIAKDSTINYSSFIFTVRNISDSIIYLGRTFSVYFINREAKNRNGKWVKIDKKLYEAGICGTGQPYIILKPNEIVISKLKRYSGNFLTDFRLVFGFDNNVVYSNTFRDFINERMLQGVSTEE